MNDDDRFFSQFQETPRPEFVEALHERIHSPMNAPESILKKRRPVLVLAAVAAALIVAFLSYPPARAYARNLLIQIGAFTVTTAQPVEGLPTAQAPSEGQEPVTVNSAAEASRLAGFTVLEPGDLPEGYVLAGPLTVVDSQTGKIVVSAYTASDNSAFLLFNQYRYGTQDQYTDNVTAQETLSEVSVRGHAGVWISGRRMTDPIDGTGVSAPDLLETNWLRWEEDEIVYTIIGSDLSLESALQIADRMK
ncbi:MAG TPA: DUF4367 domain-containing protein [Anaerolineaceae bacterium]|nr:DUF4367 domain-containing protein [Anaerolineaceae bacterium]